MNFLVFKRAVQQQFALMSKGKIFRVDATKDEMVETYLSAFPIGSNPIYRERTEHDCSCCKSFIGNMGNAVAVVNGELVSIWDINIPEEPGYQAVADALAALVKSKDITNIFLHFERSVGTDSNFEEITGAQTIKWDHFFINLPAKLVLKNDMIPTKLGKIRSAHDTLQRALNEITNDAIETVLDLTAQNSIYRGEEHAPAVTAFRLMKRGYDKLKYARDKDLFIWNQCSDESNALAYIRNSVIGSLLVDLSAGKDIEDSVKAFEAKVAPANYKRPKSLITKAMIDKAKVKLDELGLTSALQRRYATLQDISVNDILFVDRAAKSVMTGNVFDDLAATTSADLKKFDKVEEVTIDKFISDILPRATSLEVMLENDKLGNLVSLIAPTDPTAGSLFKWNNNFSWSYNGEFADSIKERVKKAGGNVTGDLCCRLSWHNYDDLDFHMIEPSGTEIYFGNRRSAAGQLDVDMNISPDTRTPVENIFYSNRHKMREGTYELKVHNFNRRENVDVGFDVEIDYMGDVRTFSYNQAVASKSYVTVAKFKYTYANGLEYIKSLPSSQSVRTVWGVATNTFQKVNVMMMSPNHWGDNVAGNKHYFFMIDGCQNDGIARSYFNEFLKESLSEHRKVLEVVGSKTPVAPDDKQLSGLGFSSTQKSSLTCRVGGSVSRVIKVVF